MMTDLRIINADVLDGLEQIDDGSVQCVVTSPPYWGLRDYGADGQIGLEPTPDDYVNRLVDVFRETRRVLRDDGTLWLNIGDSYASTTKGSGGPSEKQLSNAGSFYNATQRLNHGLKNKDLVGVPWRVAFALQADGWYLRSDIIWHKPNPMPESVTDRPTKAHEYIFLLTKAARYFYDADAVKETTVSERGTQTEDRRLSGRNLRTVWTIPTVPYAAAHFATFPPTLPERCIRAGSRPRDVVLDPFAGSGTTLMVARSLDRSAVGIEINPEYVALIEKRCALPWERTVDDTDDQPSLFGGPT